MSQRYPRPSGLTLLAKSLQKASTEKESNRLKGDILKKTVSSYVNNGFTFMGKSTNINDIAFFLQVSPNRVMKEISRYSKTLASIADPKQTQETLQAMVGLLLQNAMNDRGKVQKQADMIVAAQKGKYKPFVSKEANAALKNLMESNKPLIELIKLLQGPGGTYIQNNVNNSDPTGAEEVQEAITIDSAVALINEKKPGSLLEKPKDQEELLLKEFVEDTPEVVATKQKNFELQGQFATNKKPIKPKVKAVHEERNEVDGDIVDGTEDYEDTSFEEV